MGSELKNIAIAFIKEVLLFKTNDNSAKFLGAYLYFVLTLFISLFIYKCLH